MALVAGSRLGSYEVQGFLGAGGMGEVYEARDLRLDRLVALKVLPAEVAADPDRLSRFEREAKAVAALNHPNIVTLYGIEEADGIRFLAMERIQGRALSGLIKPGGLPLKKILDWVIPIADALAAAHARGVVHRDLKPGNVMINDEGRPKILDFGLARVSAPSSSPGSVTDTLTAEGNIFGTVPYMAPELLRGEKADARADLFSFGTMLYEMASGLRPFTGATRAELVASILKDEPPALEGIRTDLPATFVRIVGHCLEKDPRQRIQSAADLRHELSDLAEELRSRPGALAMATPPTQRTAKRRWVTLSVLAAALLAAIGVLLLKPFRSKLAETTPIQSLAVLPLKNYSGDASQDFFADGMTDALIANLAQIRALKVISRTSAMQYKDSKKPIQQIAKELGVEGIVEGSVVRSGSRVRVTAQLIHAAQDRHLWASNYEREMTDILVLQSDIVRAIAAEIRVQVTPQERERFHAVRKVDPEAYETFLMGRLFLNKATAPAAEKSIGYFLKAIERDPRNAGAYVGLVEARILVGQMAGLPLAKVAQEQKETAERALAIDDTLAEGHVALGFVKMNADWDWEGAELEYKLAIELNPNYANAYLWYSQLLNILGRHEEALAQIKRARGLDPLNPFIVANMHARLYCLGRYDEGLAESQKLLEMHPDYWLNHWNRGSMYSAKGMYEEAVSEQQKAVALSEGSLECLPDLGFAYARARRRADALKVLEKLREEAKKRYVPSSLFTLLYLGLGEKGRALESLERAYQEHDIRLAWFLMDPLFKPLRSDPRFQDLRRRLKLPVLTA